MATGLNRAWDVPKRDLLDIERTNQAQSVEAADVLADLAGALARQVRSNTRELIACNIASASSHSLADSLAMQVMRALSAYRVMRGQNAGDPEPPDEIGRATLAAVADDAAERDYQERNRP